MTSCADFRERWLERPPARGERCGAGAHAERCPACRAWVERVEAAVRLVGGLSRPSVPAELEGRVAARLAPGEGGPAEAPAGAAPEPGEGSGGRVAGLLASLERVPAPAVLERLVAEELAAPEAARTRRFAGSLQRAAAPSELASALEAQILRLLPPGRRRRLLVPLAAAAAALVVATAALVLVPERREERGRPFEVRYARGAEELHPLARTLVLSLRGGAPPPAEPAEENSEEAG